MKIAITSTGTELDSTVEPRFGRCPYFALVDTETGGFEAKANPFHDAAGGAGVQAAQWVADQGVSALLTGRCGPKAAAVLDDADIRIVEDVAGTVREAATRYSHEGQAVARSGAEPFPRGQGYGGGPGAGQGRGRQGYGPGAGQGQGWGRGQGWGQPGQGRARGRGRDPCGGGQAWGRGYGFGGGRPPA
jgi:predicted Fe-Mo cluster-binding NifX family protein